MLHQLRVDLCSLLERVIARECDATESFEALLNEFSRRVLVLLDGRKDHNVESEIVRGLTHDRHGLWWGSPFDGDPIPSDGNVGHYTVQ